MSILIGIKDEHASGSSYNSEGYGGFSIDAHSINIIKEGTVEELTKYVNDLRKAGKEASNVIDEMENEYGKYSSLSRDEWDDLYEKNLEKMSLMYYSRLLILEGIVL
jgi:hypothetical protein